MNEQAYMSFVDTRCVRPTKSLSTMRALRGNPLDVFERLCIAEGYDYERLGDHDLHLTLKGLWCDHDVSIRWNGIDELIKMYLLFEGRIPGGRSNDICRLMSLLNERLTAGHFDYSEKSATLVYRNTLSLSGGAVLKTEQAMNLLALALDGSERGYPACQYVAWAGKSPEDAIESVSRELSKHV